MHIKFNNCHKSAISNFIQVEIFQAYPFLKPHNLLFTKPISYSQKSMVFMGIKYIVNG